MFYCCFCFVFLESFVLEQQVLFRVYIHFVAMAQGGARDQNLVFLMRTIGAASWSTFSCKSRNSTIKSENLLK